MLNVKRADSPGVKDGKLILRFLAEDERRYDLSLSPLAATEALLSILRSAKHLPQNNQATVEGAMIDGTVTIAVDNEMKPLLAMNIGGLEFAIKLSDTALGSLHADIGQLLSGMRH